PGAGIELEILRRAAVEIKTPARIARHGELDRIANAIKTLVVKSLRRELGIVPIAGRDIGSLEPQLIFVVQRHELDRDPLRRNADIARPVLLFGAIERERA